MNIASATPRSSHWMRLFVVIFSTFLFLTPSTGRAAPFPQVLASNALTKGQLVRLLALGQSLPEEVCGELYCKTEIPPLYISVGGVRVNFQVAFTSASFPRNVTRVAENGEEVDDLATRPVLLRGYARVRHAGASGETAQNIPVAGTLFRDSTGHYISLTTRKMRRSSSVTSPSVVTVRIPVQTYSRSTVIKSRVSSPSSSTIKNLRCGTESVPLQSSGAGIEASAMSRPQAEPATTNTIFLATDFDSQFASDVNCTTSQCNNKIVSFVNGATVFYEGSLGISLSVKKQYGPTSISSSTTASTVLEAFKRINNTSRSAVAVDLYQLYTGKNLTSNVIGLAFVGVTCSQKTFANMLVQRVSDAIDPVTVAHETGHTLSASHPATPEGGIMDATVSATIPSSFSTRSLAQMRPYLDANYPKCLGGVSTPSGTPTPSSTNTPEATATPDGTVTPTPGPGTPTVTPTATPVGVNTPRPTPTPRTGRGGNSVGDGKPRTIALSSKLGSKGTLTLTATVSDPAGCTLTLSAGANDVEVDPGTTLAELVPTSSVTTWKAEMPFRVKASTFGPEIFFFARRTCEGTVIEVSKFTGVRPSRVALRLSDQQRRAYRLIAKRAWINNLRTRIVQQ